MNLQLTHRKDALEIVSNGTFSGGALCGASFSLLPLTFVFALLFCSTTALVAREREDLDISMTARRVEVSAGTEKLVDESVAKPGDIIHYTAQFRNQSAKSLSHLAPTIPVPAGMEYVPSPNLTAPVEASLDGQTFEAIPVRRARVLADGRRVMIEIPAAAYRALRWQAGELAPGATFTAAARVRVVTNLAAQP